ncbi:MAG: glycosyltransferase [Candidatus Pacebacteria bacterium]|nr:glycosyltransferase [Candidatus Paceibacterota bacterium]
MAESQLGPTTSAQSQATPYLSVVIPSYNELSNLKRGVLPQVLEYLHQFEKKFDQTWELILSDDGSTDGTLELLNQFAAQDPRIKVLANQHAGKGPTVSKGMLTAKGKWRLFTDFDQSTPLSEVEKLLAFTPQYDLAIGSREIAGALRDKEPFYRHLMGRGFNFFVQALAVRGIEDTQCGFKLMSAQATDELFPKLYIYSERNASQDAFTGAFDVELLFLARKKGFKTKEVPILWKHYQTDRVNPIKDSWRMFKDIIKIRLAGLKGKYR